MESLPGTQPLTMEGDLAAQMVAGIDRFFQAELTASVTTIPPAAGTGVGD